ncbi:GNVR domain-containing protein [Sphingomonas crusticola]|uniref:GNVR domain-containing protein n=1 Tax=Sphingomonas crusticola TaxID=1697973 RepID=UPI000E2490AD|nr:GNVR domain-containing protein [Sphingomonas crusticola]
MTFLQFLYLLRARMGAIVIAAAIGAMLAIGWIFASARTFDATAQLLVNVRAPETVGSQSFADQLAPDYLSTQVDIIRSRRVALAVVKALGLDTDAKQRAAFRASKSSSFQDFLINRIRAGLSVAPVSTSRVVSLTYSAADPQFAAAAANAYASAYQDTNLKLQTEPARQSVASYEAQARAVQDQIAEAQRALSEKERFLAITSDSDQSDAEINRLNSLSGQLATAQAEAATLGARASNGALPDAIASPVTQGIQGELAKLEAQRAQLASYAGPNNLDLIQINRQIAALRDQLSQQHRLVAQSASAAAAQGGMSVGRLSAEVAAQRGRAIGARANRDAVALLKDQVANLKQTYEQIVTRRAQLGILSEGSQTNVSVLSFATTPVKPAWPRPFVMLALGLVAGTFAGIGYSIIAEMADQRLRKVEDIEAWLGVRSLGAIRRGAHEPRRRLMSGVGRLLPLPGRSY